MDNLQFSIYDPSSNTRVSWDIGKDGYFGVTVKKALSDLINAVAAKTGQNVVHIMASDSARRFVLRVEPKGKGENQ